MKTKQKKTPPAAKQARAAKKAPAPAATPATKVAPAPALPFGSYTVQRAECPLCRQSDRTAEFHFGPPYQAFTGYACGRCDHRFPPAGATVVAVESVSEEDRSYLCHETMKWLGTAAGEIRFVMRSLSEGELRHVFPSDEAETIRAQLLKALAALGVGEMEACPEFLQE